MSVKIRVKLRLSGEFVGNQRDPSYVIETHGGTVNVPHEDDLTQTRAKVAEACRALADYVAEGRADRMLGASGGVPADGKIRRLDNEQGS